ncbi:DUF2087 domain-containing protein [Ferdinandcohnia sp. Marseille-Q9671]
MKSKLHEIDSVEKKEIITTYFKNGTRIQQLPGKERRKLILLEHIVQEYFEMEITYTEKEVNDVLKTIYHDHVLVRRHLIEYGFMKRSRDCMEYWVV